MTKAQMDRVFNATVRIKRLGGQGVLVPGGFVLTAAHCIKWSGTGGMALGDMHIEELITRSGANLRAQVIAAEPVADIAVLGAPDGQVLFEECEAFEEWYAATSPVPLMNRILPTRKPLLVQVLTHKQTWIGGKVTRWSFGKHSTSGCFHLKAAGPIRGGTSGGPVVNLRGNLVGVISNAVEVTEGKSCDGSIPIAALALPKWIHALICAE